jgi:hypothetical protein
MSLFNDLDLELFSDNKNRIADDVERIKLQTFEPTKKEMDEVTNIILDFVKTNKRKIYGGFALNKLIKDKSPKDVIYGEFAMPDIDFYSPSPLQDLVKLCNLLHEKKFKAVSGKEAQHKETYSIFVNQHLYCDISYVPKNIYNNMPFKDVEGLTIIGPDFMIIDYFRMINDPLTSYRTMDKFFKRFYLLQKFYPLPHNEYPIKVSPPPLNLAKLLNEVFNFIENKTGMIVIGFYAYNQFLHESKITQKDAKFNYLDVPYFEIISTNYQEHTLTLVDNLKKKFPELANDINIVEFYPFFQFMGFSANIMYKNEVIAKIYHYNRKCVPYHKVPNHVFRNKSIILGSTEKFIQIGTHAVVLMYAFINMMKARVNRDNDNKSLNYTFISHLVDMKNYYFEKKNKNIFDKTLFQDFVTQCTGETMPSEREFRLRYEANRKNKKFQFRYEPETAKHDPDFNYVFANSSGNEIKNPKNLKLSNDAKKEKFDEVDTEEEQEQDQSRPKIVDTFKSSVSDELDQFDEENK